MNIILFYAQEVERPLPRRDPRAIHLLGVLRRRPGDTFDAGLINGPRGKGTLVAIGEEALTLSFAWAEPPPPLSPISLLIGLPRPQTTRDILREATALGVSAMHFVRTERGEPGYATSSLWKSDAWKEHVISGAVQAFCTRLPVITHGHSLAEAVASLPPVERQGEAGPAKNTRIALDIYESPVALSQIDLSGSKSAALALGSERGWSAAERELLLQSGFTLAHLGRRVLRTETACIAAVTLLKAKLGEI